MWDRLERLSGPAVEPVTLAEVKAQCRIDSDEEDALLQHLIRVARDKIVGPDGIGVVLVAEQWRLSLDGFPCEIWIPMGPVLSIDGVTYVDEAGLPQTVDAAQYQWRRGRYEAFVRPAYGAAWPAARSQYGAVQVTFTAGFPGTEQDPPDLSAVPATLKHAMLLLIAHYYDHRAAVSAGTVVSTVPLGFEALIADHRVGRLA